ncbi:MAG: response regulator transcription factor [Bacteroides sp.]|nr:response regulator transcription factor [Prevotella sp.]MCM1407570.1 response regulator transcription factor [Treponema brennaborense]MCM1469280.1 response regulator transcription factor [Bacteroides sp.]
MANMLIADDMEQISSILGKYAEREGFTIYTCADGAKALELFRSVVFDIILLDVMMPKLDGFSVCKEIRKTSLVPVIMITARGEDFERIMGLDIGADDYIVKPFSPAEVMARVRSILRRVSRPAANHIITQDNLTVDTEKLSVAINGAQIAVTKKEFELLALFAGNPDRVYSREQLLDIIWGNDYYGDSRTVDSHIKRLRAKLDFYPHENWNISTIWGTGYKFETQHSR